MKTVAVMALVLFMVGLAQAGSLTMEVKDRDGQVRKTEKHYDPAPAKAVQPEITVSAPPVETRTYWERDRFTRKVRGARQKDVIKLLETGPDSTYDFKEELGDVKVFQRDPSGRVIWAGTTRKYRSWVVWVYEGIVKNKVSGNIEGARLFFPLQKKMERSRIERIEFFGRKE
ncbi:MAG: hypothetical protein KKB20_03535 [Proteobacteria bacterium]|nr:hypothetical protein [Pseudomonadota bacterium]